MKRILLLASAMTMIISAAQANSGQLRPQNGYQSKTVIEGAQEVPAVETDALGNVVIHVNRSRTALDLKATFTALEGDFTRFHIHCAPAGQNGPVALGFVDLVAVGADNSEDSILGSNTLRASVRREDVLEGNACGVGSIRDVVELINAGGAYFNLHTTAFPAGELRGQINPLTPARDGLALDFRP